MTFIVFDQGARIDTPWYDIFPPKTLDPMSAAAASRPIAQEDENKEGSAQSPAGQKISQHYQTPTDEPPRALVTQAVQIMSHPAAHISATTKLSDAWRAFSEHKFRHFAVTDNQQQIVGILSDRDVLLATSAFANNKTRDPANIQVQSVMSQRVLSAQATTSIRHLAKAFYQHRIGALPIVNHENEVIGMVTRGDILKALINEAPLEIWT
jgi:CBS domain-containing protein